MLNAHCSLPVSHPKIKYKYRMPQTHREWKNEKEEKEKECQVWNEPKRKYISKSKTETSKSNDIIDMTWEKLQPNHK